MEDDFLKLLSALAWVRPRRCFSTPGSGVSAEERADPSPGAGAGCAQAGRASRGKVTGRGQGGAPPAPGGAASVPRASHTWTLLCSGRLRAWGSHRRGAGLVVPRLGLERVLTERCACCLPCFSLPLRPQPQERRPPRAPSRPLAPPHAGFRRGWGRRRKPNLK